jgi:hypothetical protein
MPLSDYLGLAEAARRTTFTPFELREAIRGTPELARSIHIDGVLHIHEGDLMSLAGTARRIEPPPLDVEPLHHPSANENAPEQESRGAS